MRITPEIVAHTAYLARLDLSELAPAEVTALTEQLDAILSYAAQLDALDTADVPPTTHAVPLEMPMRADDPLEGPGRDRILHNAPQTADGFFVVPRVISD